MLESFHGAFERGKLDSILLESVLLRFGAFFPLCAGDATSLTEVQAVMILLGPIDIFLCWYWIILITFLRSH